MIQKHPERAMLPGMPHTAHTDPSFSDSAHGGGYLDSARSTDALKPAGDAERQPPFDESYDVMKEDPVLDLEPAAKQHAVLQAAGHLEYPRWQGWTLKAACIDLFLPGLVLVYGCFCSVAALTTLGDND